MPIASAYIQVGDQLVHYVQGGRPARVSDPPIVFVHGLSGATTWWTKNLEFLSQSNQVYAVDLPGFGQSRSNREFSIDYEVAVLARWLSAIKVQRAIVVGHSLGGYLAALLTARSPELIAGLVLVDPAIFPPKYPMLRLALGLLLAPLQSTSDQPFLKARWMRVLAPLYGRHESCCLDRL